MLTFAVAPVILNPKHSDRRNHILHDGLERFRQEVTEIHSIVGESAKNLLLHKPAPYPHLGRG